MDPKEALIVYGNIDPWTAVDSSRSGHGRGPGSSSGMPPSVSNSGNSRPLFGKLFDKLTEAVGATKELLYDGDLRRRAVPFVLSEGGRALQELQKGITRNAAALGRHIQNSGAGQFPTIIGRLLDRAAVQSARRRQLRHDQPVSVWVGRSVLPDVPQEVRSRFWFVLLDQTDLLPLLGPISSRQLLDQDEAVLPPARVASLPLLPDLDTETVANDSRDASPAPGPSLRLNSGVSALAPGLLGIGSSPQLAVSDPLPDSSADMFTGLLLDTPPPPSTNHTGAGVHIPLEPPASPQHRTLRVQTGSNHAAGCTGVSAEAASCPPGSPTGIAAGGVSGRAGTPTPSSLPRTPRTGTTTPQAGSEGYQRLSGTPGAKDTAQQGSGAPSNAGTPRARVASPHRTPGEVIVVGRSREGSPGAGGTPGAVRGTLFDADWELLDPGPSMSEPSREGLASTNASQAGVSAPHSACMQRLQSLLEASRGGPPHLTRLYAAMLAVPWEPSTGVTCEVDPDCRYLTLNEMTAGQEEVDDVILRDIHRTFPEHPRFAGMAGQMALFRLLKAYSLHDLEVGYCQGMAFAAGVMLMYLPEEPAFRLYCQIMGDEGAHLRRLYLPGLQPLQHELARFEGLLAVTQPALQAHLEAFAIPPVLYVSQWYMTVYASPFPPTFCAQLIDILVQDGHDSILVRVALTIMDILAPFLLPLNDFESLLTTIKALPAEWDDAQLDEVIARAVGQTWEVPAGMRPPVKTGMGPLPPSRVRTGAGEGVSGTASPALPTTPGGGHPTQPTLIDLDSPTAAGGGGAAAEGGTARVTSELIDELWRTAQSEASHASQPSQASLAPGGEGGGAQPQLLGAWDSSGGWAAGHGRHGGSEHPPEGVAVGPEDLQLDTHIAQMVHDLNLQLR